MEIPNIITPKDLWYIEDMMNWNLIMNKKLNSFIECCESDEVIELLKKAKKLHKKHYNDLLNIIE